jgi:hypothetical protein
MAKYLTSGHGKRARATKAGKRKWTRPANKKKKRVYPSARGNMVPRAYNVETKIIELPVQGYNLQHNDASAIRPKNTIVCLPASWEDSTTQQTGFNQVDGYWATPCYINQKFRISFDRITPDHVDSKQGFTLKMHVGRLKVTPSKFGARTDTLATYAADCLAQVYKELAESDFSSDFLEYSKRNRNIEIFKTTHLVPNRNGMIRNSLLTGTTGENYSCPPPLERSINHRVAKLKTRVQPVTAGGESHIHSLFENLWVPFVAFSCEELSPNTGYVHVQQSSRLYFQDM